MSFSIALTGFGFADCRKAPEESCRFLREVSWHIWIDHRRSQCAAGQTGIQITGEPNLAFGDICSLMKPGNLTSMLISLLGCNVSPLFGHRTFHEENETNEYDGDYGKNKKDVEVRKSRRLLFT